MDETAEYICPHCGESIQIMVDPTGGDEQDYVEDCPVCCNPNQLRIMFDRAGYASVSAQPAQ
ncbi:CPXCG motif-containing cysteine-rich protein [Phycisphaerales bacterium AB-hyl4]|uniref:CPXCG motif-containing cysteine-rich protein n=1 Tax=Natronomicrosphaera hydrolytica TaxID=3242702 RepID=A0ABV4U7F9_9BACT